MELKVPLPNRPAPHQGGIAPQAAPVAQGAEPHLQPTFQHAVGLILQGLGELKIGLHVLSLPHRPRLVGHSVVGRHVRADIPDEVVGSTQHNGVFQHLFPHPDELLQAAPLQYRPEKPAFPRNDPLSAIHDRSTPSPRLPSRASSPRQSATLSSWVSSRAFTDRYTAGSSSSRWGPSSRRTCSRRLFMEL